MSIDNAIGVGSDYPDFTQMQQLVANKDNPDWGFIKLILEKFGMQHPKAAIEKGLEGNKWKGSSQYLEQENLIDKILGKNEGLEEDYQGKIKNKGGLVFGKADNILDEILSKHQVDASKEMEGIRDIQDSWVDELMTNIGKGIGGIDKFMSGDYKTFQNMDDMSIPSSRGQYAYVKDEDKPMTSKTAGTKWGVFGGPKYYRWYDTDGDWNRGGNSLSHILNWTGGGHGG